MENKKSGERILRNLENTDIIKYYSIISKKLRNFLKNKPIATKIWIPFGNIPYFIRRGSQQVPLYIDELANLKITPEFLQLRMKNLKDVRAKLSKIQEKAWDYFVPRKLMDFFYATNGEGIRKPIDRIFIDIDRGKNISSEQVQLAAKILVKIIKADKNLAKLTKYKLFVMWTGSSFHIYLLMPKAQSNSFYLKYFQYSKDSPEASFIGKWAELADEEIKKRNLKFKISGGHEKTPNTINIDPSQTPSGKLARVPFSLHMKSPKEIDGIAIPISENQLADKNLIKKLKTYTPEKVIKELNALGKLIP